jgi:hypothetical protein
MRPCPGLQLEGRVGNLNRQFDECDDDVGLGCRHASWEKEGGGRGGIEAISATSQTENDLYLTKTETRRLD